MLCNVHIIPSHQENEQQEQIILLEGGKLWFSPLNGEGLKPTVLPWKCHSGHIMELCDECNNCTEFQFYSEKVVRYSMCPCCDVTSCLICINQNLEELCNQECYHNKINAILQHFESSFEKYKKFRVIDTLNLSWFCSVFLFTNNLMFTIIILRNLERRPWRTRQKNSRKLTKF